MADDQNNVPMPEGQNDASMANASNQTPMYDSSNAQPAQAGQAEASSSVPAQTGPRDIEDFDTSSVIIPENMNEIMGADVLDMDDLEDEILRTRHRSRYFRALRSTFFSLIVVAAIAVIVAMLVLPVIQITGTSMSNTLQDKEIVVALRGSDYKQGDIIAFYYNNNILIKRVIARSGQWVDIADDGSVYVDDQRLSEPYVTEQALGDCDITLPYQVPDGRIFVMGDHRSTSLDSRSTSLGCISEDMVLGRLLVRVWPIRSIGPILLY